MYDVKSLIWSFDNYIRHGTLDIPTVDIFAGTGEAATPSIKEVPCITR